jgi:hypothetical protein
MTTATMESTEKSGRGGSRGPRVYKKPTPRERVLAESLAKKVKELTGRDVSVETVHAIRWCFSRWSEDPETKKLREDMDSQLKRQKALEKRQKALDALKEAEAELEDVEDEGDLDEEDVYGESVDDTDEDDSDDEDDAFGDDEKVSASF